MAFLPEPRQDQADDRPWIKKPGIHVVTIQGWHFQDDDGEEIVFEVGNDEGGRQTVPFTLGSLEDRFGFFGHFVRTVIQQVPVRAPFIDRSAFYHQCANLLVGRRVALEVVQTHRGKQVVVDWKAVSNGAVVGEAVA